LGIDDFAEGDFRDFFLLSSAVGRGNNPCGMFVIGAIPNLS
jgi:hypothetical protein